MQADATSSVPDPLDLLTPEQVADLLKIGREEVYRLTGAGVLPSVKIGRLRRVRRVDVESFIVERAA